MKTITMDKISLLNDYVVNNFFREHDETDIQYCIRTLRDNIIVLLKRKEDVIDNELDSCIYQLTNVMSKLEKFLKEAEAIRKEGGEA